MQTYHWLGAGQCQYPGQSTVPAWKFWTPYMRGFWTIKHAVCWWPLMNLVVPYSDQWPHVTGWCCAGVLHTWNSSEWSLVSAIGLAEKCGWLLSHMGTLAPKGSSHQLGQPVPVQPRGPQCQKHPLTAAAGNITLETLMPKENSPLCTACKQTASLSQFTFILWRW